MSYVVGLLPPEMAVIIDGRRGDISNTAAAYARACFDYYQASASRVALPRRAHSRHELRVLLPLHWRPSQWQMRNNWMRIHALSI